MNKQTKPELRFPEFKMDWKLYKLGKYFVERNETSTGEFPLYSLTIEHGIIPKSERYERSHLVNNIEDAYKVVHHDDFAFNPMNLRFGALARHKGDKHVILSKYYNIFYCNENASPAFFDYYLTSYNLIQFYNKMATGSLIEKKRVHYLDFLKFPRLLPSLPEQQKIASFLTAVDDKLTQLKQKKSLLEQYKKGVMQKIFSQEFQFKDENGKEYPKWEKKKLGDLGEVKMCRRIFNDETSPIGEIPFFKIGSFGKEPDAFISKKTYLDYRERFSYPKKGDLLISAAGTIGRTVVYKGEDAYYQDSNIVWIDNDNSIVFNEFLFFILQIVKYNTEGGTIQRLYNSSLKSTKFSCPCLAEQTKIANFLTALDEKINQCQFQIEQTVLYKKGLLQKMFC